MTRVDDRRARSVAVIAAVVAAISSVLLAVLFCILMVHPHRFGFEITLTRWSADHGSRWLRTEVRSLGSSAALVLSIAWLAVFGSTLVPSRIAVKVCSSALVTCVVNDLVLQGIVSRPGGTAPYLRPGDYTFPSGHVTSIAAVGLTAVAILTLAGRSVRVVVLAGVLALIATLAVSWASVGSLDHHPLDALGGLLTAGLGVGLGTCWAASVTLLRGRDR